MTLTPQELILFSIIMVSAGMILGLTIADVLDRRKRKPGVVEIVRVDEFDPLKKSLPLYLRRQAS